MIGAAVAVAAAGGWGDLLVFGGEVFGLEAIASEVSSDVASTAFFLAGALITAESCFGTRDFGVAVFAETAIFVAPAAAFFVLLGVAFGVWAAVAAFSFAGGLFALLDGAFTIAPIVFFVFAAGALVAVLAVFFVVNL